MKNRDSPKSLSTIVWEKHFCSEIDNCDKAKEKMRFDNYCIKKGKSCEYILVGHDWRICREEGGK